MKEAAGGETEREKREKGESEERSVRQTCYLDPRDKRRCSSTKAWTLGKQKNDTRKEKTNKNMQ